MSKKALLMILDGWGLGDQKKDDVIFNTPTPYWDYLMNTYPHSQLQASGENVGLPDGQMGNSEVGHLNIGAGRVVYQDLVKINRACADNSILKNPEIVAAFSYAKENGKNVHFMGLTSNGGVHSSLVHLFKLCDIAKEYNIDNTFIHCFMDGRDTDPKSGKGFIEELSAHCEKSAGKIASIIGRYYAMDRDKRWERVKEAYDLLVKGEGKKVQSHTEPHDQHRNDQSQLAGYALGCQKNGIMRHHHTVLHCIGNASQDRRECHGQSQCQYRYNNLSAKMKVLSMRKKDLFLFQQKQ